MVLPDSLLDGFLEGVNGSQCTYRCVVLPDDMPYGAWAEIFEGLNAPAGAWCSLTGGR